MTRYIATGVHSSSRHDPTVGGVRSVVAFVLASLLDDSAGEDPRTLCRDLLFDKEHCYMLENEAQGFLYRRFVSLERMTSDAGARGWDV